MSTENNKDFQWTDSLVEEFHQWYAENKGKFEDHLREFKFQKLNGEKRHPEYEIVSMKCKTSGVLYHNKQQISHCLQRSNFYAIHSVRRLSDGEVFTLGDELEDTFMDNQEKIDAFLPNYKGNQLWLSIDKERGFGCALSVANKRPTPKPLFTTEDGVDIYEETVTLHGINTETWIPGRLHFSRIFQDPEWKWFAIPYNRDRYILMNKPTLSLNEVLGILQSEAWHSTDFVEKINQLAKAKL
jgi:hypothetical protein